MCCESSHLTTSQLGKDSKPVTKCMKKLQKCSVKVHITTKSMLPPPYTYHLPHSAEALASASCTPGENRYLSCPVNATRSPTMALSRPTIMFLLSSLPVNWPRRSCSFCRTQHVMVQRSRCGTLDATVGGRAAKAVAYLRICGAEEGEFRGRMSRFMMRCGGLV